MNKDTSIINELGTLAPLLNRVDRGMPYAIPDQYFQQFYSTYVANWWSEPTLGGMPKQPPYWVPTNYFQQLYGQVIVRLGETTNSNTNPIQNELLQIAPFLAQMPKQMPYAVPINASLYTLKQPKQAIIMSLVKSVRWWYTAAACVVTIMLLAGVWRYQLLQQRHQVAKAEIGARINQLSDAELANYLLSEQLLPTTSDTHDMANIPMDALFNLQDHLQMCTDEELKTFLKENELAVTKHKVSKGG